MANIGKRIIIGLYPMVSGLSPIQSALTHGVWGAKDVKWRFALTKRTRFF